MGLEVFKAPKKDDWLRLRKTCVTSTEASTLAGMPKYGLTPWQMYQIKRGAMEDSFVPTERTIIGEYLEPAIAKAVMDESNLGARILRLRDFYRNGSMGASFDYEVAQEGHQYDGWLVEIKNVDGIIFSDQWEKEESGRPIPPDHIALQIQHQLEVARRPGCILAPLVAGNRIFTIPIWRDEDIGRSLKALCDQFMQDVAEGNEPDVMADDAKAVADFYSSVDPKHVIDATDRIDITAALRDYYFMGREIKRLEDERAQIKADLLLEIQDAAKVIADDGLSLDAGYTSHVPPTEITPEMVGTTIGGRKGFRRFTVRKKA